jgi:ankyrin repeat protein
MKEHHKSLTLTYKAHVRQELQELIINAVSSLCPTLLIPECQRLVAGGRSAVTERQGLANGGDFMTRCSVALHRRLCHVARADKSPDVCLDEQGQLQISTRSDVLGVLRVQTYAKPLNIANALVEQMPSDAVARLLSDIRVHEDACIVFTTQRHMLVQRKRAMFPCTHCGLFYKGERGIRDHMLVKHQRSYEQSRAAATETRTAMIPYWRTGSEADAQWIESLEAEATALSAARNLINDRALPPGVKAASLGDIHMVKDLVENKGWNPTANDDTTQDRHGSTALMWSCGGGHMEVCKYLVLQCGMNPKASQARHRSKRTPLHWAARNGHLDICQWLVHECNVNPDVRTADGTSAFHYAVMCEHAKICRWLHSIDVNIAHGTNSYGCNAVQWAALSGSIEMCCMLLEEFNLNFALLNHNGHSVFHKAAVKGHAAVCHWLLVIGKEGKLGVDHVGELLQPDKGGCTPLEMARLEGHTEVVAIFENV